MQLLDLESGKFKVYWSGLLRVCLVKLWLLEKQLWAVGCGLWESCCEKIIKRFGGAPVAFEKHMQADPPVIVAHPIQHSSYLTD